MKPDPVETYKKFSEFLSSLKPEDVVNLRDFIDDFIKSQEPEKEEPKKKAVLNETLTIVNPYHILRDSPGGPNFIIGVDSHIFSSSEIDQLVTDFHYVIEDADVIPKGTIFILEENNLWYPENGEKFEDCKYFEGLSQEDEGYFLEIRDDSKTLA